MNDVYDIEQVLRSGGEQRIALLRYCVMSYNMEAVLLFLAREYRLRPTHAAALALFDAFCAPQAPARIRALELLPPRDLRLASAIEPLRRQTVQMQRAGPPDEENAVGITAPHRHLFDFMVEALLNDPGGHLAKLGVDFDPALTPQENLPGGRLNEAQRHFVENVWRPIVKPHLVAAGFWQIADIE